MPSLPQVVHAEYRGAHRVHLTFNDGLSGTVDLASWLDAKVFEPLRAPNFFQGFFIDGGTLAWPNGADFAPESLYEWVRALGVT